MAFASLLRMGTISRIFAIILLLVLSLKARGEGALNPETNLDHSRFVEIMIGEYGIFRPTEKLDGILTEGLASCIGVVLYHRPTQTGLIAHFWPLKDIKASFKLIQADLERLGLPANEFEGYIANGPYTTIEQVADQISSLVRKMGVKINHVSIFGTSSDRGTNKPNLLLDLRSGKIQGFHSTSPTLRINSGARLERYIENKERALDVAPESL